MFDKLQEHIAHSAPCASRWDGFDRGDRYDADELADWQDAQNEEFDNFVGPLQPYGAGSAA